MHTHISLGDLAPHTWLLACLLLPCVLFVAVSSEGRGACRSESLWRWTGSRDRMKIKVGVDVRSVNPKALTFSTSSRTQTLPFPCHQRQRRHFLFNIRVYIYFLTCTAFCEWHKGISLKSGRRCEPSAAAYSAIVGSYVHAGHGPLFCWKPLSPSYLLYWALKVFFFLFFWVKLCIFPQ